MNKQIKELENECYEDRSRGYSQPYFNVGKFAELIVKECCEEIDSVSIGDYGRDEYDKGYDAGLRQAIETIKEHFGIK